ncbi:AP2 family transcription factor [Volvox carteri f. nagariensis]|uniref:AP2 family transcription factor n=1 Tax=Volvox carteri f. nagariensis TaxID=3068 RepID=D8U6X0_VOLCA|nr:AP2 family transcription factor [Volvox carteri f. nagariensis]EFJ44586.1 AP2 family transcription factor [Volvox carteri f. nagariensis]|eukprot:XP_002954436.1 AP2 family transcription factor [Volvox carteri f. nagariensis]
MPDDDILCNKTAVKEHGGAKIAAGDALPGGRVSGTRVATSCYRGVCWHRKSKRWQSAINSSGRHVYLGSFDTEEEAARMFDKVAIRIRGAKAKLNFPYKDYVGPDGEFLTDPKLEQLVHAAYKALLEKQQRHRAIEDGHAAGSGGGGGSGAGAKRRRLGSAAAGLASDDSEPGDLNCSVGLPLSAVPWNAGRLGWGPGPERCAGANVGYDFGCSPGGGGGDGSDAVMHPMHGAMGRTGLWGPVAGVVAPSGGHGPAEPLSPPSPTAPPAAGQCDAGMAPLTAQQPGDQRVPYHHHHQLQQQFQDQHFVPKDAIGLTPGHFGDHGCGGGLTATATAVAGASTGLPSAAVHNPPTPYGGTPRHRAYAGLCLDLGRPESGRIVVLPREADFPEAVSAAAGIRTHSGSFISVADDVYDSLYDADNTLSHPKRTCISRQADGSDSGGFLRSYPRQVVNDTEIVLFGGGGSGGGGGGGATAVSAAGGSPTSALVRGGKRNGVAADDGDGSGYGRNTSGSCDSTDDTFLPPPGLQRRLPPPSLHAVLPGGGGGSGGGGHNRDGGVCCPAGPRYPLHYPGRPVVVVQRANDPLASGEIRLGGGGGDDDAGGRVDRNGNHHPAQRHWDMGAAAIWRRHGEAAALASSSAAAAAAGAADGTAAAVTASAPTVLYEVADGMALTQTTTTLYGKRSPMHDQRRATSVSWWQYQQQSQQ